METANIKQVPALPTVGMGAYIKGWTDRYACTVIDVSKSGKVITVQRDNAKRLAPIGMNECQNYKFTADPNGRTEKFSLRVNNAWVSVGSSTSNGYKLYLGIRDHYHDYSF